MIDLLSSLDTQWYQACKYLQRTFLLRAFLAQISFKDKRTYAKIVSVSNSRLILVESTQNPLTISLWIPHPCHADTRAAPEVKSSHKLAAHSKCLRQGEGQASRRNYFLAHYYLAQDTYATFSCILKIVCLCQEVLTVPATDFDDMNVLALNLERPKSHTWKKHFRISKLQNSTFDSKVSRQQFTFTFQFLSTNKLGDFRSQCTMGGLRQ